MDAIIYPLWDWICSMLSKGVTGAMALTTLDKTNLVFNEEGFDTGAICVEKRLKMQVSQTFPQTQLRTRKSIITLTTVFDLLTDKDYLNYHRA